MHTTPATLDMASWPLRTDRLVIRQATPDDLDATWRYRSLPEVSEWLTGAPTTREAYAEKFLDVERLAQTLVIDLAGDEPAGIGDLMVSIEDAWSQTEVAEQARGVQAELGWVIHPDQQGHGYASEAVIEVIRMCFEDLHLRRITAGCFAANDASWRMMEKLGMRRETATVRESLHRSGQWMDGYGYAMLADEWRERITQVP